MCFEEFGARIEVWGQVSRRVRDETLPLGVLVGGRPGSAPALSRARSLRRSFTECSWGPVWYVEGLAALTAPVQAGLDHDAWPPWAR